MRPRTILHSRLAEGKVREAAALLRDILAGDLDNNVEDEKSSRVRIIFERNHAVLKAATAEGLLEEAKEIVGLMAARGMKIASFDFSQICQASPSLQPGNS